MGEVSRVNDDHHGNFFLEPVARFPEIEADEAPLHLLGTEYPAAPRQNRLPGGPCREPP